MCSTKLSPEQFRTTISWPSGSPGRLYKEEGVHPPPQDVGRLNVKTAPMQVGGVAMSQNAPGDFFKSPGGYVQNSAPSVSGDPDIPRPPTREELILLLKGCDALGGHGNHHS
ncbi:hypothetical protein JCM14036_06240 [Desulfotomaculum defluvii]